MLMMAFSYPSAPRPGAIDRMEALEFRHDILRYLIARSAHRTARWLWSPRFAPLHPVERPLPNTTRPGWLRLQVRRAGICGTDYQLMTADDSLYLEPEATYPFIPGHEIVGTIDGDQRAESEITSATLQPGTRVVVWPVLGCRTRGIDPPCRFCESGWDGLCERRDAGWPGSGVALGFNRDTGGGWADACLAHQSQLWPLPDEVSDEDAVLLDPALTALAGLLRGESTAAEKTLVIGGGTIGLLAALLHRGLGLLGDCELLVRHEFQAEWAHSHGIQVTLVPGKKAFCDWATDRGIGSQRVPGYGRVFRGIYDRVIDAAGTRSSLSWALNAVRPGGHLSLLAAPHDLKGIDPTPIWYREVTVGGMNGYGPVPWEGESKHPFDILIPRLADGTLKFRDLITHSYPLRSYVQAFGVLARRRKTGAIKVTFVPSETEVTG